jgi:two-component system chemotaxis sensor kinase CheA
MIDKQELAKRLMATFLEELHEHTGALSDHLLALEKGPGGPERSELLKSLFRSAHSLKGAARAVGVGLVEQVCHRLEDVLADVRDGRRTLTPELVSLFLEAADAIEEAGMRLREEQRLTDSPLSAFVAKLDRLAGAEPAGAPRAGETETKPVPASLLARAEAAPATAKPLVASQPAADLAPLVAEPPEAAGPGPAASRGEAAEGPRPEKVLAGGSRTGATVRVASEKLDSLLAQSGELLVARRRVELRGAGVEGLREWVTAWRAEWRRAEKPLLKSLGGERADGSSRPAARLPRRVTAAVEETGRRLKQLEKELDQLATGVALDGRVLRTACDALDEEIYQVRMLPFAEACGGLERAVRDLARATGKDVALVLRGADVSVDRSVLEGLKDPLLHLVRNAVDHGVERPDQRQAAGKPARATVTVSAALRGDRVEVVVADDGRGFDVDRIRAKLRVKGIPVSEDDREVARLAFLPGISTAAMVTDVSGRGVGLDVVQDRIESLHGSVDVSFQAGAGTSFALTVPLTLTTIRCVLVTAGGPTYAVATTSVAQFLRFRRGDVRSVAGREVLLLGESPIPVASLAETLGRPRPAAVPDDKTSAVILAAGEQKVAFVVDQFLTEQEVLVKSLGARLRRMRHVTGATLLPTGQVALVLNAASVIRTALGQTTRRLAADADQPARQERWRLLVVEDSLTTRTLMKSILEAAGYEISVAVDGQQAWRLLAEQPVDLVVTDVEMPRMDGFQLTAAIRGSKPLADLPVVLVTSRGSDADKRRGIEVGANAYLVKSGFDQENLLRTIKQLL